MNTIKNRAKLIYISVVLLVLVVTGTFSIYKLVLEGKVEANGAKTIISLNTDEADELVIYTEDNFIEYNFSVNNFTLDENNEEVLNEVVSDYYIKVTGVPNVIMTEHLYKVGQDNSRTELFKLVDGNFLGYYNTHEIVSITDSETTNYVLKLELNDTITTNSLRNINIDIGYEQHFTRQEVANAPDLIDGMIPVKWDSNQLEWVKVSSSDENWYNYDEKKWANVVTATSTYNGNQSYELSPNGTVIPSSAITTMFVWIPRFVYRIPSAYYHTTATQVSVQDPHLVDIQFSKGENEGGDRWNTAIRVVDYDDENVSACDTWITHPAFTFGEEYLNGFWMSKFQASNIQGVDTGIIDEIRIVAGVYQLKTLKFDAMFNACRNMETMSSYGFEPASALNNDQTFASDTTNSNNLDIHLVKNSEWVATAFLAHSKYGIDGVNINTSTSTATTVTGGSENLDVVYTTEVDLSSTANPYGVYDMATTVWDTVVGFIGKQDGVNYTIGSALLYAANDKYKDRYDSDSLNITTTTTKNQIYGIFEHINGAGIWEISTSGNASTTGWFNGRANIGSYASTKYSLLITRGGSYSANTVAYNTAFAFGYAHGNDANSSRGFRPVIAVKEGI